MNKSKLRAVVIENGETLADLAKALDMSYANLSLKINGRRSFRQPEIQGIIDHYNLNGDEAMEIFFTQGSS